tara:strand:+ start:864 stop:2999 length:2136 start_codon:yes stop_codon:yes gene_type:complete
MEAVECGAASLSMVLGYFGCYRPLAEVRMQCGVSRDGSKATNILKAAKHYGFRAKGLTRSFKKLQETQLPVVIFWNFNHFVTLEGFGKNSVFINDPGVGHREVSIKEFKAAFTGVTLSIQPGEEFKKTGRKPSVWPSLFRTLRGYEKGFFYIFLASLLLVLPQFLLPAATQVFIDNVLLDKRTDWFRPLISFLAGVLFLQVAVDSLKALISRRLQLMQMISLNTGFIWRLLRLPISFYTQRYPGEVVDRTKLNDSIAQTVSGPMSEVVANAITMLVLGTVLCFYNVWLTLIGIGFSLVNFLVLSKLTAKRKEANLSASLEMGKVQGCAIAGIQSIETIKAGGQEITFYTKFGGYLAKGMNSMQRLQSSSLALAVLPDFAKQMTGLLILLLGGLSVMEGQMTVGMLVAFYSMMTNFLRPLQEIFNFSSNIQELTGNVVRVEDVMSNPPEPDRPDEISVDEAGRPIVRLSGQVEVDNLQFGFNPNMPPLIEDFSLKLNPGNSVALVGGSGSGKSTIAKIVCGLYKPLRGEILIGGTDLAKIPSVVFRNTLGFVEQEFGIFEGSIRDNLSLLDRTITDENIIQAAKDAEIHDVIQNMPKGYETILLENGGNLSGGQRQRLELARALVNNPSIVILDEATSALDAETEQLVMLNLRRRGCSLIIVAHRLSTIRDSDEIIVLASGKVKERGTHNEMIVKDGPYSQLVKRTIEEEQM